MESQESHGGRLDFDSAPHFSADVETDDVRAWEEIDTGRFMPRRIRGSYKGRALG
jgi:hypothetical protein